ncbi:uncharacterized protein NPIL_511181 [Nephila pilipes]|uniref:Uncharacterized protein n=1 Tax=Nephila pilipes TaxID=299642 RepID=A0A8X6MNV2_NEPPI|nr:uncharacterized protein NPIL_511181 [Nephila pilipes]
MYFLIFISLSFQLTGSSLAAEAFESSYALALAKGFNYGSPIGISRTIFFLSDMLPQSLIDPKNVESVLLGSAAVAFVDAFSQAVKASEVLTRVFDHSRTTGLQYSQFVKKNCFPELVKWKMLFAEVAAEFATRVIAQNFPNLPPPILVIVYGYTLARFLLSEKLLNQTNAENLALGFAKSFEDMAKYIPTTNPEYESWVICKGFINFINSQAEMNSVKGWRLAIYMQVTWMLNAVLLGPGNFFI